MLKTPPSVTPRPIGAFIWKPFNRIEHSLSHGRDNKEFDSKKMIATIPKPVASQQSCGVTIKYHLHRADSDATILAGSSVLSSGGLCPPFESCPNRNLFKQFFGIEFIHKGHTHVRAISTYEYAHCFGLVESIQYRLSHELGCAFRLEFRFLPVLIFRNSGYSAEFPEFRGTHVGIKSFQGKINLLRNSGSGIPEGRTLDMVYSVPRVTNIQ